jgi:O-succinylbenzoate synthase
MPDGAIRVDANGGWTVPQAHEAITRLVADGPLDYAEQPCAGVEELAEVRRLVDGACDIAADESIRRATDPMRVAELGAADVAVVKVAPLGGVRAVLAVADALRAAAGVRVTVSSALDTAVGLSAGIVAAACIEDGNAAGLGTGGFFTADLGVHPLVDGALAVRTVVPTAERLAAVEVFGERRDWWLERLRRCHALLPQ